MAYYDPFSDVLDELGDMHDRKGADYGRTEDPYANVRGSQEFGVQPWVGAMVRANDKVKRLQKAASGGTLANEGIEDSLIDLAVYAIIALILWREGLPEVRPVVRTVVDEGTWASSSGIGPDDLVVGLWEPAPSFMTGSRK